MKRAQPILAAALLNRHISADPVTIPGFELTRRRIFVVERRRIDAGALLECDVIFWRELYDKRLINET